MILFVGYQGEGTLGGHLQEGVKTVRIDGQECTVRCDVRSISGFSAHADEPGLLAWLRQLRRAAASPATGLPARVFLVHGDPDAQQALSPKVEALGLPTRRPRWHQRSSWTEVRGGPRRFRRRGPRRPWQPANPREAGVIRRGVFTDFTIETRRGRVPSQRGAGARPSPGLAEGSAETPSGSGIEEVARSGFRSGQWTSASG